MKKIEVNHLSESGKASLKSRVIYAILMVVVSVPCLVFGGYAFAAFLTVVGVCAMVEVVKVPQKQMRWYVYGIVMITFLSILFWSVGRDNWLAFINGITSGKWSDFSLTSYSAGYLYVNPLVFAFALVALFIVAVANKDFTFADLATIFTLVILVAFGLQCALYLRFVPFYTRAQSRVDVTTGLFKYWQSIELILFVIIGTFANDMGAYFVGVFFGKHHMAERISPKKTWEGFFGGWIIATICSIAFGLGVAAGGMDMLPGVFDLNHWYLIVLAGILIPILGVLGDFSFSLVKRHYGFKDYSKLLGAHGGILDRIDSLIFSFIGMANLISIALVFVGQ